MNVTGLPGTIIISDLAHLAATQLDLGLAVDLFEVLAAVSSLMANAGQSSSPGGLVPPEVALARLRHTLQTLGVGFSDPGLVLPPGFPGAWEGTLSNGEFLRVTLDGLTGLGLNLTASCSADLELVWATEDEVIFQVEVTSGPCIDRALLGFVLRSAGQLDASLRVPGMPWEFGLLPELGFGILSAVGP